MRNQKREDKYVSSLKEEAHYDDHLIPLEELCTRLDTNTLSGLASEKALQVLRTVGPNAMAKVKGVQWWTLLVHHFFNFLAILLWIASGLCLIAFLRDHFQLHKKEYDNLYLSLFIITIIFVSGFFGFYTAKKSHDIMSSFKKMLQPTVRIIRDGAPTSVPLENVVPGDLVVLRMGDCVPADIRVVESSEMKVDNSALTGESEATAIEVNTVHENPVMSSNIAFFSTHVVEGHGKGIVIRTGRSTYMGRIAELTASIERDETPLEHDIRIFVYGIAAMAFTINLLVFIIVLNFGYEVVEAVILLIGLTVALIPEGLSITLTVSLSLTAKRMAEKQCLVKNINAISTLGSVSVICSDKTGTLTLNKMTVMHVWFSKHLVDVTQMVPHNDPDFLLLVRIAALCNRADFLPGQEDIPVMNRKVTGDASETAILKFFEHYLGSVSAYREMYPKVYEEPFNSSTKYQMSIHELREPDENGAYLLVVKGAPEKVIPFCSKMRLKGKDVDMTDNVKEELDHACEGLALMGERVLAMAERILSPDPFVPGYNFTKDSVQMTDCVFVGLISMEDPPRESVAEAVSSCRAAGIKVVMVTGDHPTTAASIARQIGIISPDSDTVDVPRRKSVRWTELSPETDALVLTGTEIAKLNKNTLSSLIAQYDEVVFARTSPTQKLLIVESIQDLGHIVAVTGDGVNDAPALRQAHVGVAMGVAGSDVAKESADIILLNDDFSSIVDGIREGRLIIDNIKKSLAYVLTSNVPELVPFLLNAFTGIPIPLTVIFILLIDAFTDLFPAISLAYEKPESDIMLTNPRKVTERIVNCKLLTIAQFGVGMIQACAVMVAYFIVYMTHGFWPSTLLHLHNSWIEEKADVFDSYGRLPFSVVASLNGVHMFTKSQGVTIRSTSTEDATLVWEEFEDSGTRASEWIVRRLLRAAFGAMVLLVGLEEIRLIRNADRFKRELRVCFPLLDILMDAVDSVSSGNSKHNTAGNLLGLSEAILCHEHPILLSCLETYASCIDSLFACLIAHGREVVATPAWSDLHPLERQLLAFLVVSGGPCSSSDIPVFLPYKSPSVAFRLVSVLVIRDVYVMALCGPTPSLAEAEHLSVQCWAASIEHLHNARSLAPNNIPPSLTFDNGILGFLIIRTDVGRYVLSSGGSLPNSEKFSRDLRCPNPSSGHRGDVLRTFYHQAAAPLLLGVDQLDSAVTPDIGEHATEDPVTATHERAQETYWCSEYHKCHGIRIKDNVLCVLYAATVPTHTMRLLTQKTYKLLTTEKQLGW